MFCKKCDEYMNTGKTHQCPPGWMVWIDDPDYGESDGRTVYAHRAGSAAVKFAERYDPGHDYTIASQGGVSVLVRELSTGWLYRVQLSAATVIEYSAKEPVPVEETAKVGEL